MREQEQLQHLITAATNSSNSNKNKTKTKTKTALTITATATVATATSTTTVKFDTLLNFTSKHRSQPFYIKQQ